MKKEERKRILKFLGQAIIFIGIFLLLFTMADKIFLAKNENLYNYKSFMAREKNSIQLLVMGSSHSMDGIEAREVDRILKEEYGRDILSFNMSVTGMRLEQIFYRFQEALKTQSPSLLVIETFSCAPQSTGTEESINRWSLDYVPLSKLKLEYIEKNVEEDLKTSFQLPFIKYHSRWKELTKEDREILSSEKLQEKIKNQGFVAPEKPNFEGEWDDYFSRDFTAFTEQTALPEEYEEYLDAIIKLCKEIDCKILFLSIPYKEQADFTNLELIKYNNYIREQYVDDTRVWMYDMNREINSLNWGYEHMTDEGHVNNRGREVINRKLAEKAAMILGEEGEK